MKTSPHGKNSNRADTLRVALVQGDILWENPSANRDLFEGLTGPLAGKSDLVLLPEMFTTGFTMNALRLAEEMTGETVAWMRQHAETLGAALGGSLIIAEGQKFYNRFVIAFPGGEVETCDKRHLFPLAGEDKVFSPGTEKLIFTLKGWRLSPFICYDLRFPVWLRNRHLACDCLLFCASWPAARHSHWEALLRARAIENLSYCIGVNRTGTDGNGVAYRGGSVAFDFAGEVMAEIDNEEAVALVNLRSDALDEYRQRYPYWRDADE